MTSWRDDILTATSEELMVVLNAMLDAKSLTAVLDLLRATCDRRADILECEVTLPAFRAARDWSKSARRIEKLIAKIEHYGI